MKLILQKMSKVLRSAGKASAIILPLFLLAMFLAGWWIGRPATKSTETASQGEPGKIWTCSICQNTHYPTGGVPFVLSKRIDPPDHRGNEQKGRGEV